MKQQTLPWNVTGIPPEARQLARDAASREGLSVGDWLTRRIVTEAAQGQTAPSEQPERSEDDAPGTSLSVQTPGNDPYIVAKRLAQVEAEADTAFRAFDETLRALSRRLEASERLQLDATRAMSAAASEINDATREQAQAFETLTQRIDRVERTATDGGPLRDAVRALHQALSRLAEQVARTSTESSAQINGIAGNVDSLADRMTAAQGDFAQHVKNVADRSEELTNRLKDEFAQQLKGVADRSEELSNRLRDEFAQQVKSVAERSEELSNRLKDEFAQQVKSVSERSDDLSNRLKGELVQQVRSAADRSEELSDQLRGDFAQHVKSIAERTEDVSNRLKRDLALQTKSVMERSDSFSDRLKIAEERLTLVTPLEDVVLQLQVRMTSVEDQFKETIEHNFEGIERNLENIGARLERIERSQSAAGTQVHATMRALNDRLDEIDLRSNESLTDLRAGLDAVTKRLDAKPEPAPAETLEAIIPDAVSLEFASPETVNPEAVGPSAKFEAEAPPHADIPPMPERPAVDMYSPPSLAENPPFPSESFDHAAAQEVAPAPPVAEIPAAPPEEPPAAPPPAADTYLASARRAAQAAASAEAQHQSRSSLSGIRSTIPVERKREHRTRPLVAAALLLFLAGLTGFLVVRGADPLGSMSAKPAAPKAGAPTLALAPAPAPASTADQTASAEAAAPIEPQGTPSADVPAPSTGLVPAAPPASELASAPQTSAPPAAAPLDRLLTKAKAGSAPAALLLGLKYADGDGVAVNDGEAARWLMFAGQRGQPIAQYRLGTFYERGRGVTADNAQAFFWYKQAAISGNRKAMHNLAVAYANGLGTEKNFTEAARWFRAAAELGLTDSQFNLAVLSERGLGVAMSVPEAYKWYLVAASGGDAESKTRADALAAQMQPPQKQAGDKAAQSFVPKPMDKGANEPPDLADVAP